MASKIRKNKVKFHWTKELIFLIVFVLAILGVTIALAQPTKEAKALEKYNNAILQYNSENSTSYNTLTEDHVFKEISHNSLAKKKNDKGYTYVLYGLLDNGTFLSSLASLNSMAKDNEIKTVYLYFATWVSEQEDQDSISFKNECNKKEAQLNDKVDPDHSEFDLTIYPTLLVFYDGELIYNSQTYKDNTQGSWNNYINDVMTIHTKRDAE